MDHPSTRILSSCCKMSDIKCTTLVSKTRNIKHNSEGLL
uniref:Uncharacterized protein n=1 Tax=Terrapene triunguis TaxID=2587831 RepID=A0A674IIP0_9SAUR